MYLFGVTRGSSICLIACAPGIIPYLVSKNYDWRTCLRLAIIFNIPRIVILTVLGIIIGASAFLITQGIIESTVNPLIGVIQRFGYALLGLFVLIFGAYMFMTSIETKEDLKEGSHDKKSCKTNPGESNPSDSGKKDEVPVAKGHRGHKLFGFVQKRFKSLSGKPNRLFFIWGGIMTFACLGEVIVIEVPFFSGSLGILSDSVWGAAFFGGFGMFIFAIGAAMPIIVVAIISSSLTKYFNNVEKLETIRTIGGMVMIMVGLVMIIASIGGAPGPI
jgi:sulfite exporter TauE/SafE